MPTLRRFGEPMNFSWSDIVYPLAVQAIIIVMLCTCGNPVLFKSKDVRRHTDGALILKPDVSDFVFTAIIFLIGGSMGFAAEGWLCVGIFAFFGACLWIAWRANRHRIILTDQHMTVLSWRRFEVFKKDITSYKIERDEDEGDQVMWIEVQAGERKCRLRKGLVGSREQERAMLDFLGETAMSATI